MPISKGKWMRFECDGEGHGKIYIKDGNTIDMVGGTFKEIIKTAEQGYGWYVNMRKDICYCPFHKIHCLPEGEVK